MDPSVLLMLSNLLNLQSHLDPLLADAAAPSAPNLAGSAAPSTSLYCSSSPAPLLFLAIASVLSYATASRRRLPSPAPSPSSSPPAAFHSLSSAQIWSLDPLSRDSRWRSLYGLSYPVFATLVEHLDPLLRPAALPLPSDSAVSLALARLSRGLSPKSLSRSHHLPETLISKVTNAVTRLLATKLYPDYVRIPSGHRLLQTIQSFRDLTSLPNLCGAVDGSPIRLRRAPATSPEPYRSRHGYPAVLLQVVADARKIFWDVCVKAPGSTTDAAHFRDSLLYRRLSGGEILRDGGAKPYIVGDWAFPLSSFLLTPFTSDGSGSPEQNAFDAAVMKGKAASVDSAIGLLKGRWRILRDLNAGIDYAAQTIVACCVLHNMCQIAGEPEDEDVYMWKDPEESSPPARALESERGFFFAGEALRQAIAEDLYDRQQRLSGSTQR